jgi:hypothetical protein
MMWQRARIDQSEHGKEIVKMFFKLLMIGLVVAAGTYYYDKQTAPTVLKDAKYSSIETENRCKNNHESMCKYYMTVKLDREKLFYKFEVPQSYYHVLRDQLRDRKFPVVLKLKKIFPARVVDVNPKLRKLLDEELAKAS